MIASLAERRWAPWALFALLALWLPFTALFHDIDYDESQYLGAVALMRTGLPFRDFFYLQTPLHPLLLAPFAWIAQGWLFVALRLATAAAVGATMVLVYRTVLVHGGSQRRALLAVAFMALCEPVIFIGAVARNDATPMLLEAIGTTLLLRDWRAPRPSASFLLAGLFMGAAISTKLQFALIGIAAGLVMLVRWRRLGVGPILLYLAGGLFGCLPMLIFWRLAPDAFAFAIFRYPLTAPGQWYHLGHRDEIFSPFVVLLRLFRFTAVGPTLIAIGMIVRSRIVSRRQDDMLLLLDALIAAGLIAGILPQPIFRQYLAPLYPVLFMRFGLTDFAWPRRRLWQGLLAISLVAALVETADVEGGSILANAIHGAPPPVDAVRDAHWIARAVPAGSRVAGLAPERYVDSGLPFDRRFSTGPFIFRTEGLVLYSQALTWHVVPRAQMGTLFAADPPDAIVAGGYRAPDVAAPHGLDADIEAWARGHGWTGQISPSGAITVYLRPERRMENQRP